MTIQIFSHNNDDDTALYKRAIIKRIYEMQLVDWKSIRFVNQETPVVVNTPTIVIRPFRNPLTFIRPELDLEGYHTGYFTPPVVSAIIDHLKRTNQFDTSKGFIVVGKGIGSYLIQELNKLGKQVGYISHETLLSHSGKIEKTFGNNVLNCSRVSVNGCLINLCDNPREISKLTLDHLFSNITNVLHSSI